MKKLIIIGTAIAVIVFTQATVIEKDPIDKETLGRLLFFDPILSKDSSVSCASCHRPEYAFADTSAISSGVNRKKGSRNTPTAMNLLLADLLFWDGRAKTLEEQALAPIENPIEMNLPVEEAVSRLQHNRKYSVYFKEAFNTEPTKTNLSAAIAAFERTLETGDSPFDNWKFSDNPNAVSDTVKRGFALFNGKANCVKCHFGSNLTANEFRNIGLFNGRNFNDSGRSIVSGKTADIGKFKTSSLRNIAVTSPYMHNGMFKTLDEVIDFYNDTRAVVPDAINKDSLLSKPLGLTVEDKIDLKAFLISLTDKRFKK